MRGPALGPAGGVPAVAEEHPVGRAARGVGAYEVQCGGQGARPGEVQPGEGQTRGGGVDVGVGEGRRDERAAEVDDLVHALREGVGGALGTDPGDAAALDDHRGGEGIGGAVHLAPAEENGPGRCSGGVGGVGGAVSHADQCPASPTPARPPGPRSGTGQTRGGRAS